MKQSFASFALIFTLVSSAAVAQDLDAAKYAQPPIPTLAPAANTAIPTPTITPVAPGSNVPASSAEAPPSATPPAPLPPGSTSLPMTATSSPPDGEVVSPTPQLVSADGVKKKESMFFTPNQLISIMRANQGFIAPREAYDKGNQSDMPSDSATRVITLSAIIYHGKGDWTIWLNGEKVTPKNIPDRIMGLTVKQDRIHLRWMDIGRQRIVNITLHPNQKYMLDTDEIVLGSQ